MTCWLDFSLEIFNYFRQEKLHSREKFIAKAILMYWTHILNWTYKRCSCYVWNWNIIKVLKLKQVSFISELERTPFKRLFRKTNDSIVKLMVSAKSGIALWCRPCYKNMLNWEHYKKYQQLSTQQKQIFFGCRADTSLHLSSDLREVREFKILFPNFKEIA